jgi:hypothetical protein
MPTRDARPSSGGRLLLERIASTAPLAQLVPSLPPEVLHRVIEHCGLEDCGELVALATPGQLAHVLDRDLWPADLPGLDERFDAARFGTWLEVLVELGAPAAARTLSSMDPELVVAGFAAHIRAFDPGSVSRFMTTDGELAGGFQSVDDAVSREIGGCVVVARRLDAWDAVCDVLIALADERPDAFGRVIAGCITLSDAGWEDDLDDLPRDRDQQLFDVALGREERREAQGFVAPGPARAFLATARGLDVHTGGAPPPDPIARASVAAVEAAPSPSGLAETGAVLEMLLDAGVLAAPPRALLAAPEGHEDRLGRMHAWLAAVHARDPIAYAARHAELTFLGNAILAGCSIDARAFTAQEASEAALATCNLGLEHWPRRWPAPEDLIRVFQVGWSVLHTDVGLHAAERLLDVLGALRGHDSETGAGLDALRFELATHARAGTPWRARDAMDVLATLDIPAWTALLGLIDECPVVHGVIGATGEARRRGIDPNAFAFIATRAQIAEVRTFLDGLPAALYG